MCGWCIESCHQNTKSLEPHTFFCSLFRSACGVCDPDCANEAVHLPFALRCCANAHNMPCALGLSVLFIPQGRLSNLLLVLFLMLLKTGVSLQAGRSINHHGSTRGCLMTSLLKTTSSFCSSCLALDPSTSPCLTVFANFFQPNLAIAQVRPMPAPPSIPVGAIKNPTPLANAPIVVPATAAVTAPTAAYLAYRTKRQKRKIPTYRRVRRKALVR